MNAILEQINSMGKGFVEFAFPMLVQSSVLIVILLLVDLALRKRVRAVFRYCIWMLVLVKLVLPSSLSSPLSFGYLFGDSLGNVTVSSMTATAETGQMPQPMEMPRQGEARFVETISMAPIVTPMTEGIEPVEVEATGSPVVSMRQVTWQGVVFLVWLVVVGAMVLLLLQRTLFVRGLVVQAKNANSLMNDAFRYCCGQMGMKSEVGLKVSANATSPAVCGLFRPVILVPQNLGPSLGSSHLRAVLLHELAHIKRRDLWVNLVQTILQIIYFYNPLLWLANSIIRKVREQAVDETVQVAMGKRAQQYPETLVNVAKLAFKRPALSLRLIGVVESKSALKGRIKHLLNRPIPKSAKLGILGLIVVLIIGAILLPMATSAAGRPEFIIKGTVTDAGTGQPIAGAKVGDVDKYSNGRQRTITDSDGKYSYATWYEEHGIKAEAPGYEIQHKGLYTKLFGSEKEKVLDFQLTPAGILEQSAFKKTLSNGVTVELVGVCEYPSAGKEWWQPDGAELKEEIRIKKGDTVVARGKAFAFAVKMKGPEDMTFTWGEIEGSSGTADLEVVDSEGQTISDMEALKVHIDETRTTTSMRIGVATGDWMTVAEHNGKDIMSMGFPQGGIAFSQAHESDKGVKITVSDNLGKIDHRIAAIDGEGNILQAVSGPWVGAGKIRQTTANFEGLSLEQIKEFQLQTRPYEWVEFRNVSLRPGVKTDVQVEDNESNGAQFIATLPNGVTVELVGVCDWTNGEMRKWRPDGTPLNQVIYLEKAHFEKWDDNFGFFAKFTGPEDMSTKWLGISGATHSSSTYPIFDRQGDKLKDHEGATGKIVDGRVSTSIRFGGATGPWRTIAEFDGKRKISGEDNVVFSSPIVSKNGTVIAVRGEWVFDGVRRIIATDTQGKDHKGGWSGRSSSEHTLATTEFRNLSPQQIQSYKVQFRPYEWVEFKNVSLKPNFKTDVQIEVKKSGHLSQSEVTTLTATAGDYTQIQLLNRLFRVLKEDYEGKDWAMVNRIAESIRDVFRDNEEFFTERIGRDMAYRLEELSDELHDSIRDEELYLTPAYYEQLIKTWGEISKSNVFNPDVEVVVGSTERVDYSSVTVTEGVGFDEIIVGDPDCTGEFIKSKFGKPDKEVKNEKDWWLDYREKYGLDFWVCPKDNVLREIRLNKGFEGKLTSGVSMSSAKEDVFDVYGEPVEEKTASDFDKSFENQVLFFRKGSFFGRSKISKIYYNQHGLLLWFEGDKINQIVIHPKGAKTDVGFGVAGKISDADKRASEDLAGNGWQLWRERKLAEAEEVFKKAVEKDPTNANTWNGLGWSQSNQGKVLNAKVSFEKCLAIDPKHAAALNGLGWIAKGQGKTKEAIGHWEKAVEAAPTATAALSGLGQAYMELKQYDKAAKYYQMWLNVEPNNAQAKSGLEKAKSQMTDVGAVERGQHTISTKAEVFGKVTQEGDPSSNARIIARVYSNNSQPGVDSPLISRKTRTDEEGYYHIYNLPAGKLSIAVMSAVGNLNVAQKNLELMPGQKLELDFGDEPGYTVTGTITLDDEPIELAEIFMSPEIPEDYSFRKWGWTNEDGRFRITGLAKGAYRAFIHYDTGLDPETFLWSEGESFGDFRKINIDGDLTLDVSLFSNKAYPNYMTVEDESAEQVALLRLVGLEHRVESAKKLSGLGKSLLIYANDHEEKYPDTLQELRPYNLNERDFQWLIDNVEYLGKGKPLTISPQAVIAYDKTLSEKGNGTNVLFNDAHVEFVNPEQLKKLGIKPGQKTDVEVEVPGPPSEDPMKVGRSGASKKRKEEVLVKLVTLSEQRERIQQDMDYAERALQEVRTASGFTDLEEQRSYPNPITSRLIRLEQERDNCHLAIAQLRANIKNLGKREAAEELKNAADNLAILEGKLEALDKMIEEAKARKRDFDRARVQYKQRTRIRDERQVMLDSLKGQIEKMRMVYDEVEAFEEQLEVARALTEKEGKDRKGEILAKLRALSEQRNRVQGDLAAAELALQDVRASSGFTDLEERGYRHPITERLMRLEQERDNCHLEIAQLRAKIENLLKQPDSPEGKEKLKKVKDNLTVLEGKLEALDKMRAEAKARKGDLDLARVQYKRRARIRDERQVMLDSLKAEVEKWRIMYDEAERAKADVETERR